MKNPEKLSREEIDFRTMRHVNLLFSLEDLNAILICINAIDISISEQRMSAQKLILIFHKILLGELEERKRAEKNEEYMNVMSNLNKTDKIMSRECAECVIELMSNHMKGVTLDDKPKSFYFKISEADIIINEISDIVGDLVYDLERAKITNKYNNNVTKFLENFKKMMISARNNICFYMYNEDTEQKLQTGKEQQISQYKKKEPDTLILKDKEKKLGTSELFYSQFSRNELNDMLSCINSINESTYCDKKWVLELILVFHEILLGEPGENEREINNEKYMNGISSLQKCKSNNTTMSGEDMKSILELVSDHMKNITLDDRPNCFFFTENQGSDIINGLNGVLNNLKNKYLEDKKLTDPPSSNEFTMNRFHAKFIEFNNTYGDKYVSQKELLKKFVCKVTDELNFHKSKNRLLCEYKQKNPLNEQQQDENKTLQQNNDQKQQTLQLFSYKKNLDKLTPEEKKFSASRPLHLQFSCDELNAIILCINNIRNIDRTHNGEMEVLELILIFHEILIGEPTENIKATENKEYMRGISRLKESKNNDKTLVRELQECNDQNKTLELQTRKNENDEELKKSVRFARNRLIDHMLNIKIYDKPKNFFFTIEQCRNITNGLDNVISSLKRSGSNNTTEINGQDILQIEFLKQLKQVMVDEEMRVLNLEIGGGMAKQQQTENKTSQQILQNDQEQQILQNQTKPEQTKKPIEECKLDQHDKNKTSQQKFQEQQILQSQEEMNHNSHEKLNEEAGFSAGKNVKLQFSLEKLNTILLCMNGINIEKTRPRKIVERLIFIFDKILLGEPCEHKRAKENEKYMGIMSGLKEHEGAINTVITRRSINAVLESVSNHMKSVTFDNKPKNFFFNTNEAIGMINNINYVIDHQSIAKDATNGFNSENIYNAIEFLTNLGKNLTRGVNVVYDELENENNETSQQKLQNDQKQQNLQNQANPESHVNKQTKKPIIEERKSNQHDKNKISQQNNDQKQQISQTGKEQQISQYKKKKPDMLTSEEKMFSMSRPRPFCLQFSRNELNDMLSCINSINESTYCDKKWVLELILVFHEILLGEPGENEREINNEKYMNGISSLQKCKSNNTTMSGEDMKSILELVSDHVKNITLGDRPNCFFFTTDRGKAIINDLNCVFDNLKKQYLTQFKTYADNDCYEAKKVIFTVDDAYDDHIGSKPKIESKPKIGSEPKIESKPKNYTGFVGYPRNGHNNTENIKNLDKTYTSQKEFLEKFMQKVTCAFNLHKSTNLLLCKNKQQQVENETLQQISQTGQEQQILENTKKLSPEEIDFRMTRDVNLLFSIDDLNAMLMCINAIDIDIPEQRMSAQKLILIFHKILLGDLEERKRAEENEEYMNVISNLNKTNNGMPKEYIEYAIILALDHMKNITLSDKPMISYLNISEADTIIGDIYDVMDDLQSETECVKTADKSNGNGVIKFLKNLKEMMTSARNNINFYVYNLEEPYTPSIPRDFCLQLSLSELKDMLSCINLCMQFSFNELKGMLSCISTLNKSSINENTLNENTINENTYCRQELVSKLILVFHEILLGEPDEREILIGDKKYTNEILRDNKIYMKKILNLQKYKGNDMTMSKEDMQFILKLISNRIESLISSNNNNRYSYFFFTVDQGDNIIYDLNDVLDNCNQYIFEKKPLEKFVRNVINKFDLYKSKYPLIGQQLGENEISQQKLQKKLKKKLLQKLLQNKKINHNLHKKPNEEAEFGVEKKVKFQFSLKKLSDILVYINKYMYNIGKNHTHDLRSSVQGLIMILHKILLGEQGERKRAEKNEEYMKIISNLENCEINNGKLDVKYYHPAIQSVFDHMKCLILDDSHKDFFFDIYEVIAIINKISFVTKKLSAALDSKSNGECVQFLEELENIMIDGALDFCNKYEGQQQVKKETSQQQVKEKTSQQQLQDKEKPESQIETKR